MFANISNEFQSCMTAYSKVSWWQNGHS